MKFIITGNSCAFGTLLTAKLIKLGHEVIGIGRSTDIYWELGQPIPELGQGDTLIHLAHDRSRSLMQNTKDIRIILQSFNGFTILISSISAHSRSQSIYGKSKYAAEQLFVESGGAAIKSGLIYGSLENRFLNRISINLRKYNWMPLPYSGNSRFFLSHSDDLLAEILHIALTKKRGLIRGFSLVPYSFNKLVSMIDANHTTYIFKIPTSIISTLLIKSLKLFFPKNETVDSLTSLVCEIDYQDIVLMQSPKTEFRWIKNFIN